MGLRLLRLFLGFAAFGGLLVFGADDLAAEIRCDDSVVWRVDAR